MPELAHEPEPQLEFRHWGRVYAAVIATLVAVIIALWLFSLAFA
jgi:hypothetical protein